MGVQLWPPQAARVTHGPMVPAGPPQGVAAALEGWRDAAALALRRQPLLAGGAAMAVLAACGAAALLLLSSRRSGVRRVA